jgi:hypothetical protein
METQLFEALYRFALASAPPTRRPREQFNDRVIVLVYLWSVLHDRPVCWACDAVNWPKEMAWELPSDSTLSRRLRTVGVSLFIERVLAALSELFPVTLVKAIDSKPLLVGAYSMDRDAKRGRLAKGQFGRGYRIHVVTHGRLVQKWTLGSMNDNDAIHAPGLLASMRGGGYVVADNAYDSNDLHRWAAQANHQLVAPPRVINKGVRDLKYNGASRIRALDLLDSPLERCGLRGEFGQQLYNQRETVESCFGELSLRGLNYLPAWVRGPRRVAIWVGGKIAFYLCNRAKKQRLIA